MSEPSVGFDWDAIEAMPEGDSRDKAVAEAAIRRVLTALAPKRPWLQSKSDLARISIAWYLLRVPGFERYRNLKWIGRCHGFSKQHASMLARQVSVELGIPVKIASGWIYRA